MKERWKNATKTVERKDHIITQYWFLGLLSPVNFSANRKRKPLRNNNNNNNQQQQQPTTNNNNMSINLCIDIFFWRWGEVFSQRQHFSCYQACTKPPPKPQSVDEVKRWIAGCLGHGCCWERCAVVVFCVFWGFFGCGLMFVMMSFCLLCCLWQKLFWVFWLVFGLGIFEDSIWHAACIVLRKITVVWFQDVSDIPEMMTIISLY